MGQLLRGATRASTLLLLLVELGQDPQERVLLAPVGISPKDVFHPPVLVTVASVEREAVREPPEIEAFRLNEGLPLLGHELHQFRAVAVTS